MFARLRSAPLEVAEVYDFTSATQGSRKALHAGRVGTWYLVFITAQWKHQADSTHYLAFVCSTSPGFSQVLCVR